MPVWTDEQRAAIEARGGNLLLSAAAGSGKTTVLVERVLRLVAEGANIDRMLVVTFTRAAASDMRAKLSQRLNERAAAGDARCRDQLLRLERADISTLHAFCSEYLRTSFETAGVDPAFRVLDDAMAARLKDEAIDAALEEAYAAGGEALLALDYGRGPAGVRAATAMLLARMEERPDPAGWLADAARCDGEALSRLQDELADAARRAVSTVRVHLEHALSVPGCPSNYEGAIRADLAALDALSALEDCDALQRALGEFRPASAAKFKRDPNADPDAVEAVRKLREAAKRAMEDIRLKDMPLSQARADAVALAGQIETLSRIATRASALFEAAKAEQSGLTYADLELKTLRALDDPDAARAVRERYDYVFVDEYQDTSDIQEALVRAVSRGDNLFMVGDVKQSIYRFRLAEPRLFMEKYAAYARGEGGTLLPLTRNFRSARGILDFVNAVFERTMTGGDAEVVYDALARLNPGLPDGGDAGAAVSVTLIDAGAGSGDGADDADEADGQVAEGAAREGVVIARTIRRMMAEDPTLRYRDFVILTRSKATAFSAMMPVMLAHGIPAYADGQSGYFDSMEIRWVMAMLRLIDNARSDVELIAMLRSPVVGLTADELARVRVASRDVPYADAAAAYAREGNDAAAEKLRAFFARVDGWRLRLGGMGLGEFTRLVLDESGFYTYAGALPGGAQRQANLDQFVVDATGFDDAISGSLTRFLGYTERLRARGDGDAAHMLGENDDVVRMMTAHKSKGLEFRVVFAAQLGKRYHVERADAPLVSHRELGVGMSIFDPALRTRRLTLQQAAIMARQRREDAAEEMRVLYVMLTRARQRLVLVGTVNGAERMARRWRALSAAPFASTSHLDLVMAARCGAEAAGQPTHSALEIIPAASVRTAATGEADAAQTLFGNVMANPDAWRNEALERQMAWTYPDPLAAGMPLKLTASGLLRELEGPEVVPPLLERPAFLSEDARRMTGAERGTAYHRCMQLIDLDALDGLSGAALTGAVSAQLDGFANRRLLEDGQREAVEAARLARFLDGETGLRLRASRTVRREWPFNVRLRIDEALTPEEAGRFGAETLLVQGTIDCCFVEDGQWVLLDYKTDRTDDADALRAHYEKQLNVYALALERVTGMRVRQRLLCLLRTGETLEV